MIGLVLNYSKRKRNILNGRNTKVKFQEKWMTREYRDLQRIWLCYRKTSLCFIEVFVYWQIQLLSPCDQDNVIEIVDIHMGFNIYWSLAYNNSIFYSAARGKTRRKGGYLTKKVVGLFKFYFWLLWVFTAVRGLPLVAGSGELSFLAGCWLSIIMVASMVAEYRL